MDLILFGRQGSGKGTQGKSLAERYGLVPFVTGDELRKLSQEDSELGQKIKTIVEAGHLVPNEVVMEIIEHFMKELPQGAKVLFDGIPRKADQAKTFDELMHRLGRTFIGLLIEIPEELSIKRLTQRRICEGCKAIYPPNYEGEKCQNCGSELKVRSDDTNMESIHNRLEAYRNETLPVIEKYRQENKIIQVDGTKSIDEVNEQTFKELDGLFLAPL